MWKISDISPDKDYVIELRHDDCGRRTIHLREATVERTHPDVVFETDEVPHDLLRQRNLFRIGETVKLANGGFFGFDAHGIWFTHEEIKLFREHRGDLNAVRWSTATPPTLAPK